MRTRPKHTKVRGGAEADIAREKAVEVQTEKQRTEKMPLSHHSESKRRRRRKRSRTKRAMVELPQGSIRCPACLVNPLRLHPAQSSWQKLLSWLCVHPFRCRGCNYRGLRFKVFVKSAGKQSTDKPN